MSSSRHEPPFPSPCPASRIWLAVLASVAPVASLRTSEARPPSAAAADPVPPPAAEAPAAELWTEPLARKVFRDATPGPCRRLDLAAARGEWESGQIVLRARAPLEVSIAASVLSGPEGAAIPSSALELRRVAHVPIPPEGKGCPDPLLPLGSSWTLSPGEASSLLVTVRVPRGARPGEYEGAIRIDARGAPPGEGSLALEVPVHLRVWSFEIPETPTVRTAFGISLDHVLHHEGVSRGTPEAKRMHERYWDALLAHRISPYEIPVDLLDPEADRFAGDPRLTSFMIPYRDDPEWLRARIERVRERGWLARAYFYPWDEPVKKEQYEALRRCVEKIRSVDRDVRIVSPFYRDPEWGGTAYDALDGLVSIWCSVSAYFQPERMEEKRKGGGEVWWYVCCGPGKPYANLHMSMDGMAHRILPWQMWTRRIEGFLYWSTTYWNPAHLASPWSDMVTVPDINKELAGDGSLFYPGRLPDGTRVAEGPVASLRLLLLRDGLEDLEYLRLLSDRRGRDLADAAAGRLVKDLTSFSLDPGELEAVRRDVARAIETSAAGDPSEASVRGPRLSDRDLLAALDPGFPGLERAIAHRDRGEERAALAELVSMVRAREEPVDFGQRSARDPAANVSAAERVLEHRFTVVGIPHRFGPDIDWSFNPTTAPGSKLDVDHEWTWQLSRHGAWATLAEAWAKTGEARFAKEFQAQLLDWIRDCPVPAGAADNRAFSRWRTIEAGIRMSTTWPTCFAVFRRSPDVADSTLVDLVKSMVEHARYLHAHPTGGNWLTMEMNGLFHAGVLLPWMAESKSWRDVAAATLLTELDRQVYEDGAQVELTPGYHVVSLRNFLGPLRLADAYGVDLPPGYREKLERMFAYCLWGMTPDRDMPRWNDSWRVDVPRLLEEGLRLFPHRADFRWVATDGREGAEPDHRSHVFPWAGQVVFRSGWEREASCLAFEAGPFGYGHQHEDKLGITVWAYGKPILVEGGSYAYDASKWRRYVLSSAAHDVVLVDGKGQARRGSPRSSYVATAPGGPELAAGESVESAGGVYEDGFGSAERRVVRHERRVAFWKAAPAFVVTDVLTPLDDEEHVYEALFHLDAEEVERDEARGIVETRIPGGPDLRIVPLEGAGLSVRIARGEEEPAILGWLPEGHGIRGVRPIPTVVHRRASKATVRFVTAIQPLRGSSGGGAEAEDRIERVDERDGRIRLILASGAASPELP